MDVKRAIVEKAECTSLNHAIFKAFKKEEEKLQTEPIGWILTYGVKKCMTDVTK